MELGLYARALAVLERNYPAVPADQSEPGSVLPQQHPLVRYYAAYCKTKLGRDASRELAGSEQTFVELCVSVVGDGSRCAGSRRCAHDGDDATAHYLLGTLLFSKGLYDAGIAHWVEAKRLAPHMADPRC